jgi:hypothetical protein
LGDAVAKVESESTAAAAVVRDLRQTIFGNCRYLENPEEEPAGIYAERLSA